MNFSILSHFCIQYRFIYGLDVYIAYCIIKVPVIIDKFGKRIWILDSKHDNYQITLSLYCCDRIKSLRR